MSFKMDWELFGVLKGLEDLEMHADKIASLALYDGAAVVADTLNQSAQNIQTEPFRYGTANNKRLPSPEEKAAVMGAHVGISKFTHTGSKVSTSIGYSNLDAKTGYADINGHMRPIAAIAASIESGTSFMIKQPYFRKAERACKARATAAIEATAEREAEKIKNKHGL